MRAEAGFESRLAVKVFRHHASLRQRVRDWLLSLRRF